MKQDAAWLRWAMGTARSWRDIRSLLPETGIDMVDSDHRILLEYAIKLNLLAEDAGAGFSEELLERQRRLLQALQRYTKYHFDREEILIGAIGAPNLELQRSEHAKIIRALDDRAADFTGGRVSVSPELRRSIFSWIIDHIEGTDYETFRLANLEQVFADARSWTDIRKILRATGIDAIDAQHRTLVTMILDLAAALRADAGGGIPRGKLAALVDFTQLHFSGEEAFMEKSGVEGLEDHAKLHEAFLRKLRTFSEGSPDPDRGNTAAFVHELMMWLVDHVNGTDYRVLRGGTWIGMAFEKGNYTEIGNLIRATGVPLVDRQHAEFVTKASTFFELSAARDPVRSDALAAGFDELIAFAAQHFSDEERLFPENRSMIAERHFDEHRELLNTLNAYRRRLAEGSIGAVSATRNVIMGLWVTHTNGTDIDMFGSAVFDGEERRGE